MTALVEREGDGYVLAVPRAGHCEPGGAVEKARDKLREALELFFESASLEEVKERLVVGR